MDKTSILDLANREFEKTEIRLIRDLWFQHLRAEEARDIQSILATVTPDCFYEVIGYGRQWRGREEAALFYTELLAALPDVDLRIIHVVIGPQGVVEEAIIKGTLVKPLFGFPPSGKVVEMQTAIVFPWDVKQQLFTGERMYVRQL